MQEALDCKTNSPDRYYRKCIENSMEKIHTDIKVKISRTMGDH